MQLLNMRNSVKWFVQIWEKIALNFGECAVMEVYVSCEIDFSESYKIFRREFIADILVKKEDVC